MKSRIAAGSYAILILAMLLASALALEPNSTARAQEGDGLTLTARAGFDGYYKEGRWVPVRVTLANDGPDADGALQVTSQRTSGSGLVFTRPVSMPSQSRKEVFLYVSPEGYISNLRISFVSGRDVLATATTRLAQAGPGDLIYGVMAASPSAFNVLAQVDPVSGQGFVAELTPADLPPIGQAWQALDVLVLSDIDTGVFTPEQRLALAGWVAGGGRLIVAGGPGWQKTAAGLGELLPARVSGTRTAASLAALQGYSHNTVELSGTAIVAAAVPAAGANVGLSTEDGTPLIISKNVGYGRTAFLAFDPALDPLRRWDGAEGLYRNLIASSAARPGWAGGFRNWYSAAEALNAIPGLELPSALQLCGFLAIYVAAVGPLNFFILHRLKRRELAWVTIPAIILVFSGLAYLGGYRLRGTQATLHRLSVVQVWPSADRAQVDMLVGLFSPRRTEYDLEISGDSLARPLPANTYGGGASAGETTLEQDGVTRIRDLRVDIGGVESFVAGGHVPAPLFEATLQMNVQGGNAVLAGQIVNHSELSLTNAVVLAPGAVQRFDAFAPGDTLDINMPLASGRASPAAQGNAAIVLPAGAAANPAPGGAFNNYSGYDSTIDDILGATYYYDDRRLYRQYSLLAAMIDQYSGAGRGSGVYLVGWTDQAPLPAAITDGAFNPVDTTAYVVELQPQVVVSNGLLAIPPGLMSWSILDPGQQGTVTPYDLYVYQGHFSMRFTPSQPLDFKRVDALELHLNAYGQTGRVNGLEIALWDFQAGEWAPLPDLNWGDNAVREAERFVGSNGEIQARVSNSSSVSSVSVEAIDFTLVVER